MEGIPFHDAEWAFSNLKTNPLLLPVLLWTRQHILHYNSFVLVVGYMYCLPKLYIHPTKPSLYSPGDEQFKEPLSLILVVLWASSSKTLLVILLKYCC